ncbi:MAG: efflux RND transporter permease subunit [Gammaproteobacteria bacterium]
MRAVIAFIVENRLFSMMAALAILAIGGSSVPALKVSNLPTVQLPTLVVTLTLPGASPAEIENRVIFEVEDELQSLGDLDEFQTSIFQNRAVIRVKFFYGVDITDKYLEVTSKLNKLQEELPDDLETSVEKQSPSDLLVAFVYAVVAPQLTERERLQWASRFKAELRRNPYLQDVTVEKSDREVVAWLDMDRMNQYGVSLDAVTAAMESENRYLPVGTLEFGHQSLWVLPPGSSYQSVADVAATPLLTGRGKSIRLSDIAEVREQYKPDPVLHRVNGKLATLVSAKTRDDANVLLVRSQVEQIAAGFSSRLPDGVSLERLFNVEAGVRRSLSDLLLNVAQGIVILCVVLLFSVGYRSTFAIGIMLPLSLGVSLVLLSLTGFGLQQISIAGFIIALGLIVDNGIVVTENAYKLIHYQNYSSREAAVEGTGSVISPLLSSTLTTALAFLPIYLLTSETGLFMRSLAATIWLCLAASLFVAVSATTLSVARFGTVNRIHLFPELSGDSALARVLNRVRRLPSPPSFLNALIPFRDKVFVNLLQRAVERWWLLLLVVIGAFSVAVWCAGQVPRIVFPTSDDPFFTITVEATENSSETFMADLTGQIETLVRGYPEVVRVTTVQGGNFPRIAMGVLQVGQRRTDASLLVEVDFHDGPRLQHLTDELNLKLHRLTPYASINASPILIGSDTDVDTTVTLMGATISQLRELGRELDPKLRDIEGVLSVVNPAVTEYYSLAVRHDRLRTQTLGVSKSAIDPVFMLISHGLKVDEFRDQEGEEYDIVLRAAEGPEAPLRVFDRLTAVSQAGRPIPLSQLAGYRFAESQYDIDHEMFQAKLDIDLYALPGIDVNLLRQRVAEVVNASALPSDIVVDYESERDRTAETFGGIGLYTGWVAVAIFCIFILQFKSFVQPMIVFAAVPLCSIGAFLILFLTGQALSFAAFIGLTSLMGIVVNNAILLVDRGNVLARQNTHASNMEIAVEAARNRFMPILLTSITTIMGLSPLALGDSTMFKPMALVIIGGLFTSTFFTLFCVPTLYTYFSPTTGAQRLAVTGRLAREH